MKETTYKFYDDAGHGWLAVKRQELVDLGILDKITHYSYQRGKTVYLEEDCDMTTFIIAKKNAGFEFVLGKGDSFLSPSLKHLVKFVSKHCNYSPIRSYEGFSV